MSQPWSNTAPQDFGIIGLSEGLVFPQKIAIASDCFRINRGNEYTHPSHGKRPEFIRVMVGTRLSMEEWIRNAGPGSCTLWVELTEACWKQGSLLKCHLQFAYRLRSYSLLLHPVLPGIHVIAAPYMVKSQESPSCKENLNEQTFGAPVCSKQNSLRQKEKEKFLKSIGVNHLGQSFCMESGENQQDMSNSWSQIQRWVLTLPVLAYEQLANMVFPGGTIWQFRRLLGKIVLNPHFVDVKLELIDFMNWLKHHSYIVLIEGLDCLVGLSNMQWTAIRFNTAENAFKITGNKCLSSLERFWQNRIAVDGKSEGTCSPRCSHGKVKHTVPSSWRLWHPSGREDRYLNTTLLCAMYNNGGFSEKEAVYAFKQDFSFLDSRPQDVPLELQSPSRKYPYPLSSRERCALSNLGSSSKTVRQRGIHILLDILMLDNKERSLSSRTNSRRDHSNGTGLSTPVSGGCLNSGYRAALAKGNFSTSRSADSSTTESYRTLLGQEKGEFHQGRDSTRKPFKTTLSVQNEHGPCNREQRIPVVQANNDVSKAPFLLSRDNGRAPEEVNSTVFFQAFCKVQNIPDAQIAPQNYDCKGKIIQTKLLEWVDCGFLVSLIEEAVSSSTRSISSGETFLDLKDTADICLEATYVLPAIASGHIVQQMMLWLNHCSKDQRLDKCKSNQSGLKVEVEQTKENDDMLDDLIEKIWCLTKLLHLVVKGSTFVASGLAKCGGYSAIIELYSLLARLRISSELELTNKKSGEHMPGWILESKEKTLVVCPNPSSARKRCEVTQLNPQATTRLSSKNEQMHEQRGLRGVSGKFSSFLHLVLDVFLLRKGKKTRRENDNLSNGLTPLCTDNSDFKTSAMLKAVSLSKPGRAVSVSERPRVPKLILNPRLSAGNTTKGLIGFSPDYTEKLLSSFSNQPTMSALEGPSKALADSYTTILEAKTHLLDALYSLLVNQSGAAVLSQNDFARNIDKDSHVVLSSFVLDLYNCVNFVDSPSQSNSRRLQELIFEVMYEVDNLVLQNSSKTARDPPYNNKEHKVGLDCEVTCENTSKKNGSVKIVERTTSPLRGCEGSTFCGNFQQKVLEHLRLALRSDFYTLLAKTNQHIFHINKDRNGPCNQTVSCNLSTALRDEEGNLNIWQRISLLMNIIAECNLFSLKKGLTCPILNNLRGHVEGALDLLSCTGEPDFWNLPQVLAMQSSLNLLNVVFKAIRDDSSQSTSAWTDFEEQIWQLTINNEKAWTCIRSYFRWILLESSQGCFKNLLDYWKFCPDIPEPLAILLFSKPSFCYESPGFECIRNAFQCLKSFVHLIHRRVLADVGNVQDNSAFFSEDMMHCLDFLMNPVDGLLMSMLKGPFFQGRMIHTEREVERHALDCRVTHEEHISLPVGKHDDEISSSLKLNSANSKSEINSSARGLTSKDPCDGLTKMASQLRYGTSPVRSWSWQSPHLFKVLKSISHRNSAERVYTQTFPCMESTRHSFGSHIDDSQCFCKSCSSKMVVEGLSLRVSLLIEEQSLNLLAHVFRLKFSQNIPQEQRSENPFLSQRYMEAFLDYHFLCFLQLYNWKTENLTKGGALMQSLKGADFSFEVPEETQSSHISLRLKDIMQSVDHTLSEDLFSVLSSEDDTITLACRKHGEVLLSLSQNQSGDANKRFKQLKVMDFLMHQIALEYELSHVVTPRASSASLCSGTTQPKDLQVSNCIGKDSIDFRKDHGRVVCHSLREKEFTSVVPMACHKSVQRQLRNCINIVQRSMDQLGFLSYRTGNRRAIDRIPVSVSGGFPISIQDNFPSHDIGNHYKMMSLRSKNMLDLYFKSPEAVSQSFRTFSEIRHSARRKKLKELGFKRKGSLNLLDSHDVCPSVSSSVSPNTQKMQGTKIKSLKELAAFPYSNDLDSNVEVNTHVIRAKNGFVYSGRFFDLNEEVEQELAQEDASTYQLQGASLMTASETSNLKIDINSPKQSPVSASSENQQITKASRPVVPKLNLPKSVKKGDEDPSSFGEPVEDGDTSMKKSSSNKPLHVGDNDCTSEALSGPTYSSAGTKTVGLSYEMEKIKRRMYRDSKLHALMLELFISLMITPQGSLDTSYTDRFPTEGQKMNAPFYLLYHINHAANSKLIPLLKERIKEVTPPVHRILKLLTRDLFDSSLYTNKQRIAHGAFSQVYKATFSQMEGNKKVSQTVVLKTVDLPKGPYDPCKFFDIYSEVEILEKFTGDHRICQLLDYGVDIESFILVLKHYKCSLRHWRQQQNINFNTTDSEALSQAFYKKLPLYFDVYSDVLQAVKVLQLHNVVHYDLKCDNILLEPLEDIESEEEFWNPVWPKTTGRSRLPFRVCIADFGQSKGSILQGGECTVRNRGTEYVKSPEMLKLFSSNNHEILATKEESVGRAVDVWGLGCLLYELITGEYLLYDEDWTRFFMRVTLPSEELITDEKAAKVKHFKPIMEFLNFVLVRDPVKRPTVDAVIQRFEELRMILERNGIGYNDMAGPGSDIGLIADTTEIMYLPVARNNELSMNSQRNTQENEDRVNDNISSSNSNVDYRISEPQSSWWRSCITKFCGG